MQDEGWHLGEFVAKGVGIGAVGRESGVERLLNLGRRAHSEDRPLRVQPRRGDLQIDFILTESRVRAARFNKEACLRLGNQLSGTLSEMCPDLSKQLCLMSVNAMLI